MSSEPVALPRPRRANVTGFGVVQAVPSGDTIVLMGFAPKGKIPPTREIVLSGILAPRLGRSKSAIDEAYAWYAREFLRKKCIGQQVSFSINFSTEDGGRQYGDVKLGNESLAESLVRAGLATVKPGPTGKDGKMHPEKEAMMELQEKASKEGIGMWKKGVDEREMIRDVNWNPSNAFFNACKGKAVAGIVDAVLDGSRIRVEIPQKGLKHVMLTLYLAGISCARVPPPFDLLMSQWERRKQADPSLKEPKPVEETPLPFAKEAQFFVQARLLSRDVKIVLHSCDKFNNMFGSILFPRGNITFRLLEEGLAEAVSWSAGLTGEQDKIMGLERAAKAARVGRWADYTGEEESKEEKVSYSGKVIAVLSGDTVLVKNPEGGEDKCSLASVRAPREPRRPNETGKEFQWGWEAKEYLRNRIIGKKVSVVVEYTRMVAEAERKYVTLTLNGKNVAEELVLEGFATLVNHRTDEPRSCDYGKLLMAENSARSAKKGQHGPAPKPRRIVDLTQRAPRGAKKEEGDEEASAAKASQTAKARQFLSFLQREKKTDGIVEYVFGGARLKVMVPKENLIMSFVLAGVRCPSSREADPKTQALARKAAAFTRNVVMQQNVRVEVETLDRGENFIGTCWTPNGQNLAILLLKAGLASVFDVSADRSPYRDQLYAAEAEAKEAKIELWENYVEAAPVETNEEDEEKEYSDKDRNIEVKLTEIVDAANFYAHILSDSNVQKVEEKMKGFSDSVGAPDEDLILLKGKVYAGSWDGSWYRVRCDGPTAQGNYRVFFLDYGNHDLLEKENMRALDDDVAKIPGCARSMALAGIKAPRDSSDYFNDSCFALHDLCWGRTVAAKVECRDRQGKLHVALTVNTESEEGSQEINVSHELLRAGWVRVLDRPEYRLKAYTATLREHEEFAKRGHYNLWEYGDVSDEESDGGRDTGRPGTSRFGNKGGKSDDKSSKKSSK